VTRSTSVRALVLAARRRWLAARWLEHALLGGAVAGGTLATAILSGAAPTSMGAVLVAALCGALAALTLACERRRSPRAFARRLDERLAEEGALATAFECEGRSQAGAVAALHAARTAARLDPARVRSALPPASPVFLAALALGAGLAALAIERDAAPVGSDVVATRAGSALARVAALASQPADAPTEELADALWTAAAVGELEAAPTEERERAALALESLLTGPGQGLEGEAERVAQALLDRLRSGPGGDPGGAGATARTQGGGGSEGPALAAAPLGRTMSDQLEEPPLSPTRPPVVLPPDIGAAAAPSGRWWPRRHDAVVAGYVQRTRAALGAAQSEGR